MRFSFWWLLCQECTWPFRVSCAGPVSCSRCGHRWIVRLEVINGAIEAFLEDECKSKKENS